MKFRLKRATPNSAVLMHVIRERKNLTSSRDRGYWVSRIYSERKRGRRLFFLDAYINITSRQMPHEIIIGCSAGLHYILLKGDIHL
jgi:hypothetical protein